MKTVLVVDDEENIRETLKDVLEDDGYKVFNAGDGRVALEILQKNFVDVVLLDLWLPKMGGIEVLQQIKGMEGEVPVIIISGHGTIDAAVKATKEGAFDFIEKPLSIDRVLNVINHAIEINGLKKENLALREKQQNTYHMVRGKSGEKRWLPGEYTRKVKGEIHPSLLLIAPLFPRHL
jgi:two-component system nitrogen regulation response regulator NtrX